MNLALHLFVSAVLVLLVTVIHGTGVTIAGRLLESEKGELKRRSLLFVEFHFLVPMALFLFVIHLLEIAIFAAFYMSVGAIGTIEDALFASAAAYTTIGIAENSIGEWRLVAAFEGLAGFLMVGWSVAVFIKEMDRFVRK